MNRCCNEQRTVNSFFRDVLVAKVLKSATHKNQVPDSLQGKKIKELTWQLEMKSFQHHP